MGVIQIQVMDHEFEELLRLKLVAFGGSILRNLPSGNLTKRWKITIYSLVDLPLKMVVFHSYVSLPEGISCNTYR